MSEEQAMSWPPSRDGTTDDPPHGAFAGVLAAAVAIPVFASVGGSGGTSLSALSANSVAVIDPKSGRVVGDVPVGYVPDAIVAGAEQVWVLNDEDETASAIKKPSVSSARWA